jgi:DNA-binding NarL/FixJ family response regulator
VAYLVGAVIAVGVLQLVLFWMQRNAHQAIQRVDDRLASLTASVSLLTDAAECGLQDVAAEIQRIAGERTTKPAPRAATQRRVALAARRGRSVREIAAAEQLSEGEVRLRLQLGRKNGKESKDQEAADAGRRL